MSYKCQLLYSFSRPRERGREDEDDEQRVNVVIYLSKSDATYFIAINAITGHNEKHRVNAVIYLSMMSHILVRQMPQLTTWLVVARVTLDLFYLFFYF